MSSLSLVGFFKVIVDTIISEHLFLAQATTNSELNVYENDQPAFNDAHFMRCLNHELKDLTSQVWYFLCSESYN